MIRLTLITAALTAIFSCHPRVAQVTDEPKSVPDVVTAGVVDPAMVKGNNAFAMNLYKEIRSETDNVFYAPFSISAAMAMTYAGAREESEKQISKVMQFSGDQAKFHPDYQALLSYMNGLNRPDSIELATANSLFAQKEYPFLESYFKLINAHYGASPQNMDFRTETEKCRVEINKWVVDKTRGKIQDLLIPGMLNELTRLVLVNAIYFYGGWETAFDPARTSKLKFKVTPESSVDASFMFREDKINYSETDKVQVVELPYAGKDLSMFIFLPRDHAGMKELEDSWSADQIGLWTSMMTETKIRLLLPKFNITAEFELSKVLKKMGMEHPFSLQADLSGMTGRKDLMIDKVVHKAFIDVSEKGTEAAAATAVIIREKNGMVIPSFRADHPFLFIIRENKYGGILFAGRVNKPS